jgi:energy-coupling factor transporter ATP-binding protein EcfA2
MLETVNEEGATVVVATHDRLLMAARPHRTVVLDNGKLVGISKEGSFKSRNDKTELPKEPSMHTKEAV